MIRGKWLSPATVIEVSVASYERERSCICMLVVSILPLPTIILSDFGHFRTVSYFCIMFHFINSVVNHYVVDAITDRIKLKK